MHKNQEQELNERMKKEEFVMLHKELDKIYLTLLTKDIKIGGYIPSIEREEVGVATPGGFIFLCSPSLANLAKAMHNKAEDIAYQLTLFFPKDKRPDWRDRFICFALTGSYDGIRPLSKAGRPSELTSVVKVRRARAKHWEEKGLDDEEIAGKLIDEGYPATTADIIRNDRRAEKKANKKDVNNSPP